MKLIFYSLDGVAECPEEDLPAYSTLGFLQLFAAVLLCYDLLFWMVS